MLRGVDALLHGDKDDSSPVNATILLLRNVAGLTAGNGEPMCPGGESADACQPRDGVDAVTIERWRPETAARAVWRVLSEALGIMLAVTVIHSYGGLLRLRSS